MNYDPMQLVGTVVDRNDLTQICAESTLATSCRHK